MKQKIELSVYDAERMIPEIAVIGISYLLISSKSCYVLVSPFLLYHILMYIISIELVRFSALSPMVFEGTTSQSRAAQPSWWLSRSWGSSLYLSDLTRLFLCDASFFQICRVHVFTFIL